MTSLSGGTAGGGAAPGGRELRAGGGWLLVLAGIAAELLFLVVQQAGLDWPQFVVVLVWSAVAWSGFLLFGVGVVGIGRRDLTWWRAVIAGAPVVWLILSWGFYEMTGRFGSLEVLRFAFENFGMLMRYVVQVEPLRVLLCLVGACLVASLWLVGAGRWVGGRLRPLVLAWLGGIAVASSVSWVLGISYGEDLPIWEVHPVASLAGRLVTRPEEFGQCLEASELVERAVGSDVGIVEDWPSRSDGTPPPSVLWVAIESLRPDVLGLVHQGRDGDAACRRTGRGGSCLFPRLGREHAFGLL